MSTSAEGTKVAFKPFAYWKIVVIVAVLDLATMLVLHGLPVTAQMVSSWTSAWAGGSLAFCASEAIRRYRAKQ
jgi:hypothetical protein